MNKQENLFTEFEPVHVKAWIEKVIKDLKGKDIESLNHKIGTDRPVSPFHHADDATAPTGPILNDTPTNNWAIMEDFFVGNDDENVDNTVEKVNKLMLESLGEGIEACRMIIDGNLSEKEIERLFEKIEPSFIETHFVCRQDQETLSILNSFKSSLPNKKGDASSLKGSVNDLTNQPNESLINWGKNNLPEFKMWTIQTALTNPVDSLTELIETAINGLSNTKTITPEDLAKTITFHLPLTTNYFIEIARLRALRILWANTLKAYGINPKIHPQISTSFHPATQDTDPNQNLISATTMAMSAILGGSDQLVAAPSAVAADAPAEVRANCNSPLRRTLQHILKLESYLNHVSDPAAGSYYIEHLTNTLCQATWKKL